MEYCSLLLIVKALKYQLVALQEMNSVSIVRPGVPCRHGAAYFPKSLPRLGLYGSGKLIKKTIRNHRVWVPNAAASDEPEIPKETSVDDQGGFEASVAID